MSEARAS